MSFLPKSTLRSVPLSKALSQISRRTLFTKKTPKVVTVEEAVSVVKDNDRVYLHGVAAFPRTLALGLAKRYKELKNVECIHIHIESPNPMCPLTATTEMADQFPVPPTLEEMKSAFFVNNFFVGPNQRAAVREGLSSYVPCFLSELPALMRKDITRPNVALLNVSPPNKHGYVSLGVEVCTAVAAVETADIVIAQINPNMPRTHGDGLININHFDYIVPDVDEKLPEHHTGAMTQADRDIGRIIAGLIDDGSTLQMGIGAIPNAVLSSLTNHKNLGVHTEMFQEGLIPLMEKGIITNRNKKFLPGKVVTSFVIGGQRLYDFIDDNPEISFVDVTVTNDPVVISKNPKVAAINAAIEVDITGQVCADSVGTRHISGVGGQVDFERGAALSEGGVPIICLPSTTKVKGNPNVVGESKIVSTLKLGAGVVTSRYHSHYIVTEYGYAYLHGKNLLQRARAMIDIAHPDHREELHKAAFERFKALV
ncbi:acetyl-CoA hydrolase/transferase family protein [Basidiobolus meristosporus CBS 931.73]|uniref:Acetyl-CoA hydrolase/transferase family protein n=1 Tax=Basidiobolus meristosporus CBS 931.73 TaxID=1314790 RepID=A0A1Y1YMN0_9FUNG|nr:acetyl-CoA hydrolase/transferase family protein [Basidiobolus meristosporus CBS 931.73]|eukprot:ORX98996.1 acetyl-CoA hydrolase/transferase family protein [Basidiobolus meristosporus CBS 931.73]